MPILQIYVRDVPELPFPPDPDVCQVLWCPFVHESDYRPVVRVVWRDSHLLTDPLAEAPEPIASEKGYHPRPHVLSPERVEEYPAVWEAPEELYAKIDVWELSLDGPERWSYQYHLPVAPGTKVGGWVDWVQSPESVECGQGQELHPKSDSYGECE